MDAEWFDVSLQLDDLGALFAEPDADPFDPDSRYISGMDEVRNRLIVEKLDVPVRLTITLPDTAVTPDTATTLNAAVDRYCAAKIAENQQQIEELRYYGRRSLISAFIIVIVLMALTVLVSLLLQLNDAFTGMIAGWVGIAIWVIFWNPIDTYVYAWRPYRHEMRVYEAVQEAELRIQTTSS